MVEQQDLFGRSLAAARQEYMAEIKNPKGTHCPCCDRYGKVYRRSINATMARALIWLINYNLGRGVEEGGWIEVNRVAPLWLVATKQHGTLAYWGLIEQKRHTADEERRTPGIWRVTLKGLRFARELEPASRYAYVYNDEVIGHSTERTTIQQALGRRFNYAELMAAGAQ